MATAALNSLYVTCTCMCAHRVVYRDLKPENILMDSKGRTKISDLGECVEVYGCQCSACLCLYS